jgi:hypothetical protein
LFLAFVRSLQRGGLGIKDNAFPGARLQAGVALHVFLIQGYTLKIMDGRR